jgi:hypothetical protein
VPVAALAPTPTVVKLPVADVKLPVADVKLPVAPNTVIVNPYATQSKVDPVKNEKKRNFIFRQAGMSMEELRAQCAKYKPLQSADADNS